MTRTPIIFEALEPRVLLSVLPGDANTDGTVDGHDFDAWFSNLQVHTNSYSRADFNNDGLVDGLDFDIWFSHLGQQSGIDITPGNPGDATYTVYSGATLAGFDGKVTADDFVQYSPQATCYLVAYEAANPDAIANAVKSDGNGGYIVTFNPNGFGIVRVHTSAELPTWYHPVDGSIIGGIFDKAFAYIRSKLNTYASEDYGWPSEVARELNIPCYSYYIGGSTVAGVTAWLQNAVALGEPIEVCTKSSAITLVQNHTYSLTSISTDANGAMWLSLRNPWGWDDAIINVKTLIADTSMIYYTPV